MSDFYTLEQSNQDSQPIRLFDFLRGSDAWYYTNFPTAIAVNAHTYLPRAITRSTITMAGTVPKETIEIKLPFDDAMVVPMNTGSVGKVTTVTVWCAQASDLTLYQAEWLGRVAKTARDRTVATMTCEPVFSSLQRNGIPQPYQRTCRHAFGGKGCFVNLDSLKQTIPIVSVSARKDQVLLLIVGTAPNFIGGTFKSASGVTELVIGQSGSTVTLMRPIGSLAGGQSAEVCIGCDRSLGTCDTVHHNAGNFGAQPGIPFINPFTIQRSVF